MQDRPVGLRSSRAWLTHDVLCQGGGMDWQPEESARTATADIWRRATQSMRGETGELAATVGVATPA